VYLRPEDEVLKQRWNVAGVSFVSDSVGFVVIVRTRRDTGWSRHSYLFTVVTQ